MGPLKIKNAETTEVTIPSYNNGLILGKLFCASNQNDDISSINLKCNNSIINYTRGDWKNRSIFHPLGLLNHQTPIRFSPNEKVAVSFELTFNESIAIETKENILNDVLVAIDYEFCKIQSLNSKES